jgi:probable phosphoglycerate mutase
MMTLYLLRHASTAWNEQGLIQGRRDIPLSDRGRSEAATWRLPAEVPADVEWFSSPLSRALETASYLASTRITPAHALVEMDYGEWEGASVEDLRNWYGEAYRDNERRGFDFRPQGGESPREMLARVTPWLAERARTLRPTIAVTHLGVLRLILAVATGWDLTGKPPVRFQSGCLHAFALDAAGNPSIVRCNLPLVPRAPEPL